MLYLLLGTLIVLMVLGVGISRRLSPYSPLMMSALVWLFFMAAVLVTSQSRRVPAPAKAV